MVSSKEVGEWIFVGGGWLFWEVRRGVAIVKYGPVRTTVFMPRKFDLKI